jgi:hypothetical protein
LGRLHSMPGLASRARKRLGREKIEPQRGSATQTITRVDCLVSESSRRSTGSIASPVRLLLVKRGAAGYRKGSRRPRLSRSRARRRHFLRLPATRYPRPHARRRAALSAFSAQSRAREGRRLPLVFFSLLFFSFFISSSESLVERVHEPSRSRFRETAPGERSQRWRRTPARVFTVQRPLEFTVGLIRATRRPNARRPVAHPSPFRFARLHSSDCRATAPGEWASRAVSSAVNVGQ